MRRFFFKCMDCLSVGASDLESAPRGKMECGLCGGPIDVMGEVGSGSRLVQRGSACPCDARCTGALGPHCECQCGGKNHGSNAMVPVLWDRGPIPKVMMRERGEALRIAEEWRAALDSARGEVESLAEKKAINGWLGDTDYRRFWSIKNRILKARGLKSHAGRMKALGATMAENASLFLSVA